MADDRMKKDDMGGAGQQSPGRNPQDDLSTGQRGGQEKQNEPKHKDDFGTSGQQKDTGQGGQNR